MDKIRARIHPHPTVLQFQCGMAHLTNLDTGNIKVEQHSLHVQGQALDFFIPGIKIRGMHHAALKLQYGGVGV